MKKGGGFKKGFKKGEEVFLKRRREGFKKECFLEKRTVFWYKKGRGLRKKKV